MHQPLIKGENISVEGDQGTEKYATSNGQKVHSTVHIENWITAVENQNQDVLVALKILEIFMV